MVGARDIKKLTQPLHRSMKNLVARGVLNTVNSDAKCQELQVGLLADEVRDKVEHVEPYGFTSHPLAGAECVTISVGGNRDHSVAVSVFDRRFRFTGLAPGEVAMYTDEGDVIHFKRGNEIHIISKTKIVMDAPTIEMKGAIQVTGDVNATGSVIDGGS